MTSRRSIKSPCSRRGSCCPFASTSSSKIQRHWRTPWHSPAPTSVAWPFLTTRRVAQAVQRPRAARRPDPFRR
jgi:hypothetical protein